VWGSDRILQISTVSHVIAADHCTVIIKVRHWTYWTVLRGIPFPRNRPIPNET